MTILDQLIEKEFGPRVGYQKIDIGFNRQSQLHFFILYKRNIIVRTIRFMFIDH